MELKKSAAANNENLRLPIILMGLLFVSGIVLASFTYEIGIDSDGLGETVVGENDTRVQMVEEKIDEPVNEDPPAVDIPPPIQEEIIEDVNLEVEVVATVEVVAPVIFDVVEEPLPVAEIIDFPDVEAEFPGGAAALQAWISSNVVYPETSIEMDDQGRVFLSFVVEADGKITNIVIERGVTTELDREAKRVLRRMPNWSAGEASGRKVRTRCRLPIVFTLD